MDQGTKRLLIFGGIVYLLSREQGTLFPSIASPYPTPVGPGMLPSQGLTPNQISQLPTVSNIPAVQNANASVTQAIVNQNAEINVAGTAISTGANIGIAALISAGSLAGPIGTAIGAAIGALITLVKTFVSDEHLYANALVNDYQNPFGNNFIALVNATANALNARTLTLTEVQAAYNAAATSWANFENILHQLQSQSSQWYIVATQALNFFDNQYMGVTLPNGKVLGVGGDGQYGDTPNYGMMSSWLAWFQGLLTDPQVIQA
jgi:hypothetical protein